MRQLLGGIWWGTLVKGLTCILTVIQPDVTRLLPSSRVLVETIITVLQAGGWSNWLNYVEGANR